MVAGTGFGLGLIQLTGGWKVSFESSGDWSGDISLVLGIEKTSYGMELADGSRSCVYSDD